MCACLGTAHLMPLVPCFLSLSLLSTSKELLLPTLPPLGPLSPLSPLAFFIATSRTSSSASTDLPMPGGLGMENMVLGHLNTEGGSPGLTDAECSISMMTHPLKSPQPCRHRPQHMAGSGIGTVEMPGLTNIRMARGKRVKLGPHTQGMHAKATPAGVASSRDAAYLAGTQNSR